MNEHEHRPKAGDRFYDRSRHRDHVKPGEVPDGRDPKRQANGYIRHVDWEEREVVVKFKGDPEPITYSFDEIEDAWESEWAGVGCYMLYPSIASKKA